MSKHYFLLNEAKTHFAYWEKRGDKVNHIAIDAIGDRAIIEKKQGQDLRHFYALDKEEKPIAKVFYYRRRIALMPILFFDLSGNLLAALRMAHSYNWHWRLLNDHHLRHAIIKTSYTESLAERIAAFGLPMRLGIPAKIISQKTLTIGN
jgi:hypothetical protein